MSSKKDMNFLDRLQHLATFDGGDSLVIRSLKSTESDSNLQFGGNKIFLQPQNRIIRPTLDNSN